MDNHHITPSSYEQRFPCRVCSNIDQNQTLLCRNFRNVHSEFFTYIQCACCHSLSITTIPPNMGDYYRNYYSFHPFSLTHYSFKTFLHRSLFRNPQSLGPIIPIFLRDSYDLAYKAITPLLRNKQMRILDVGCGSGKIVFDLVSAGYKNAMGIDPYLKEDLYYSKGCKILKLSPSQLEGKWDLIMMHHVLEHMENQVDVLNVIKGLLDKSGHLLIRIPNVDSYAFRRYREYWYGIQPPVHYCLPSLSGFHQLVAESGLSIKRVLGENILEFWLHSHAYSLDIADYHKFGMRTFLEGKSHAKRNPIVTKSEIAYFRRLNRMVRRDPELCDWIVYWLGV
jgi:SAM-dependent methyltransferase